MIDVIDRGAVISDCGQYRYSLHRRWREQQDPEDGLADMCAFVGLNPSTADADRDDPTIRRCVGFAERWGFAGLVMVNLFAFRATSPTDLPTLPSVAVGRENDDVLRTVCHRAALVVAAWGGSLAVAGERGRLFSGRRQEVDREGLLGGGPAMLGLTATGEPRHPLYVWSGVKPVYRADGSRVRVPAS